jgi:hypothetical protein
MALLVTKTGLLTLLLLLATLPTLLGRHAQVKRKSNLLNL